ncbi:MAG: V/A-type H+/Na+-transporting ATPase subunit [Candidatus Atribacteria bacterium]|nr:V/A-type H+/Na+-transporting ATPase subunit [Candidatus Atribacteria bacterium]
MAVERMNGVTICGNRKYQAEILSQVISFGNFEPVSWEKVIPKEIRTSLNQETTSRSSSWEEFYRLLVKLHELSGRKPHPRPVLSKTIGQDLEKFWELAQIWEKEMSQKLEEIAQLKQELRRLGYTRRHLRTLRSLEIEIKDLTELQGFVVKFGRILAMYFDRLIEGINDLPVLVIEVDREGESCWVLVIALPRMEEETNRILNSIHFEQYTLPEVILPGPIEEVYFRVSDQIKRTQLEIEKKTIELKEIFYQNRTYIYDLLDHSYVLCHVNQLLGTGGMSDNFFALAGWVPADKVEKLEKIITEHPQALLIIEEDREFEKTGEEAPTLLTNFSFFQRFEVLVKMYGFPNYREIDPTPVVALSFLFLFGFMFGDVGHGLVLSLAGFLYYLVAKSDFGYILGWAGISSSLFGLLYGSFFGFEYIISPWWRRPMENISYFLGVSVFLGVGMVSLAMILGMINSLQRKDWRSLILGGGGLAGFGFYWLAVWMVVSYFLRGELPAPAFLWVGVLLILLVLVFLKDVLETKTNRGEAAIQSFFLLFDEILRFLSNTVSFIRLSAFAVNHAGIFLAFLAISETINGGAFAGFSRFLVLFLGNLLILGLEGLVVFIQTLRLEYYELFSRFFSGQGRVFQPFRFRH